MATLVKYIFDKLYRVINPLTGNKDEAYYKGPRAKSEEHVFHYRKGFRRIAFKDENVANYVEDVE